MLLRKNVQISIIDIMYILLAPELRFMVELPIYRYLALKATHFATGFRPDLLILQTVPFSLARLPSQPMTLVHHKIGEAVMANPLFIPILACAPDGVLLIHDPHDPHHQAPLLCQVLWPSLRPKPLVLSVEHEHEPKSRLRVRLRSRWMY